MARARDKGGATTAARRLLLVAGAVAGFWLVSWLVSGHAQAETREVNPLGEVVAGVVGGPPPGGMTRALEDGAGAGVAGLVTPVPGVEPVSQAVRAVVPVSQVARAAGPAVEQDSRTVRSTAPAVEPVSHAARSTSRAVEPLVGSVASIVEPVSQVVRTAAPVVEPVSQVVRAAAPVVEPVSQVVRAAVPVVEPVSQLARAAAPVLEPVSQVVRAAAPILEPVKQVVRILAPVLDPVLSGAVLPVAGAVVNPVADVLAPVTKPVGDTLTPVVQPIVAPAGEGVETPAADPTGKRPARHAKVASPQEETTPVTHQLASQLTAPDLAYTCPATEPAAAEPRPAHSRPSGHSTHHATKPQPAHSPGKTPAPRSPAPEDAACGAAPTIPPAFLTAGHGPRATRAFTPSHGDFVPLWRACEPGTSPG
ncbi:hypothetical protein [Amycolatopsis sp. NPDC051371]|uniref:hypothetical protein n=1 Tax=Amycolatopsis sp. NPDC051371 TaxID=3155800 RepID=UPI003441B617